MQSSAPRRFFCSAVVLFSCAVFSSLALLLPPSSFVGISPWDEKYYSRDIIPCRDDSKTFHRNHLNDGFCDCPDGTDEPGTSACPESKFYCRNIGDIPRQLFSSRVNDRICDCCDGSDEYDSGIKCVNTCLKDGATDSNTGDGHRSKDTRVDDMVIKQSKIKLELEDLFMHLKGVRVVTVIELLSLMALFTVIIRRTRIRRRRLLWGNH